MSALLSPSQAARLLDLHPNSVRRLAAEGKLPSQRVGWSRVFAVQDVQQFAEARRRRRDGAQAKRRPDGEGAAQVP
jgi:excisionase family DNA binding protein